MTKEIATREADAQELRELVVGEKLARSECYSSVQELISCERAAREKHAEELAADHEARHSKVRDYLESERRERETHRVSMDERVAYLEQLLHDSADRHAGIQEDHSILS